MKTITFEISNVEYEQISAAARKRGSTATQLFEGAAHRLAIEVTRPFAVLVTDLHAQGYSNPEIAAALGVTNAKVIERLNRVGLRANRKGRDE